jgi:hypothetical protein
VSVKFTAPEKGWCYNRGNHFTYHDYVGKKIKRTYGTEELRFTWKLPEIVQN